MSQEASGSWNKPGAGRLASSKSVRAFVAKLGNLECDPQEATRVVERNDFLTLSDLHMCICAHMHTHKRQA